MPRKKKTKKNQASQLRPMLPEGDLDTSMSIDERRAKLDVYIKDFNMQGWWRLFRLRLSWLTMIKQSL